MSFCRGPGFNFGTGPGLGSQLMPLAMSYRNHRKSLAYFRYFAPSVLFFFTKKQSQKGGAWHNAPLNRLLHRRKLRIDA